jgi:hypothetical protein
VLLLHGMIGSKGSHSHTCWVPPGQKTLCSGWHWLARLEGKALLKVPGLAWELTLPNTGVHTRADAQPWQQGLHAG